MAEIIDQTGHSHEVASNGKANTALGFGIAGTALGVIGGGLLGLLGGRKSTSTSSQASDMTNEDLYIERTEAENQLNMTKEMYEGKLTNLRELTNAFFDSYKRDVDNYWDLSKQAHDNYDTLNQKIIDSSFGLYKNQRDEKDALNEKISTLQSQVDIMSAVRPYQDALINAKMEKNAILADYNLSKRTCRMIEGQLVLPNEPVVSGYTSYYPTVYAE